MKNILFIPALLLTSALSTSVWAHGNKAEDGHSDLSEVVKEQKPWGIAGDAADISRTIEVSMQDTMRFTPELLDIKLGETIRFVVENDGQVLHEFVLGTKSTNDDHAEMMLKFPGMEHDEPYMAHVDPKETGEIIWTFNRAGNFDFACLIAGHYQAGMVGNIVVADNG